MTLIPTSDLGSTNQADFKEAFALWRNSWRYVLPRSYCSIEGFVEREVYLGQADARPGLFRIHLTEPVRQIYRAVNDPAVKTIVIMSATQFFKTQFMLNTILYYCIEQPCRIVFGMPTDHLLRQFMNERFNEMCSENEMFKDLIPDMSMLKDGAKGKQAMFQRRFPGGSLTAMSSEGRSGFVSIPAKVVILDEIDKFKRMDSIEEAEDRRKNFPDGKLIVASSPEDKDTSMIYRYYEKSNRQIYQAKCPKCKTLQELVWDNVNWDMGSDGSFKEGSSRYVCDNDKCGARWNDAMRYEAVLHGHWLKRSPDIKAVAGFQISSLYSQLIELDDIVRKFLSAREDKEAGVVETMRRFRKNQLGLAGEDVGESVDHKQAILLMNKHYDEDAIPNKVYCITCAIDVQKNRFEVEFRGWGLDGGSWGLHFVRLFWDLREKDTWKRLHDYIQGRKFIREDGIDMKADIVFIDSGGLYTQEVYRFVSYRGRHNVQKSANRHYYFPIKGASNPSAKIIHSAKWRDEIGNELVMLGTIDSKVIIYGMLADSIRKRPQCFWSVNVGYDKQYFISLCSEKEVNKFIGGKRVHKFELKRDGLANEGIDLFVYNYSALVFLAGDRKTIEDYLLQRKDSIDEVLREKKGKKVKKVKK